MVHRAYEINFCSEQIRIYITEIEERIISIVRAARVIMDRDTGRSRGFGFVSFTSTEEAASALTALDGQVIMSRFLSELLVRVILEE